MREYVEIDGMHYLKDADGNLIRIEFKPAPVEESRKARPARGRKYGAPHPSTWRIDESKAEKNAPAAAEAPAQNAAVPSEAPAGKSAAAETKEPSLEVSYRRADKNAAFIPVSDGGEKSAKARRVSENGFEVELNLKIKISESGKCGADECSAQITRKVFAVRGEPKTVKLLSFPYEGGCAEYEAEILVR